MGYFVINEDFLQQLEALQMLIKNNVAGQFGGMHKSKTYGSSCEFADYRDYMPGDDITKIDWNAYARFDKLYQKLYLDERQMHTKIYIDASRSMNYSSRDASKAKQSLMMAAMIAYLSLAEMDKVSIYVIRDNKVEEIVHSMVGKDAFTNSVGKLNDIEFDSDSCISEAILNSNVGYGDGMSVIISDFLTDNDFDAAINHLADKKRHVFCVQVLSREEINPQIRGKSNLFDSESAHRNYKKNIDRDIAKAYKLALEYVINRIRGICEVRGADYLFVDAEKNISDIFFEELVNMEVLK